MEEYSKPLTRTHGKLPALSQSRGGDGFAAGPGCGARGVTRAVRPQGPDGTGGLGIGNRHHIEFLARLLRFCHKARPCGK